MKKTTAANFLEHALERTILPVDVQPEIEQSSPVRSNIFERIQILFALPDDMTQNIAVTKK